MQQPLAPIVLFTYNRIWHTQQTLQALANNPFSLQSKLIIYADAPKREASSTAIEQVAAVRNYLQTFCEQNKILRRFQEIEIIEREHNFGLADSIIDGVSTTMQKYGKAIILEDDIVVSPIFLQYMNEALNFYENNNRVWSISAWSAPIQTDGLESCYFFRIPHCWGWASWANRWQYYKRDVDWALQNFTQEDIRYINLDDYSKGYWEQLLLNKSGKIKTWAIFNYLIAYKHKALTLLPSHSLIRQIGFDGSGTHCGGDDNICNPQEVCVTLPLTYPQQVCESKLALTRIQQFELERRKKTFSKRITKLQRTLRNSVQKRFAALTTTGGGGQPQSQRKPIA
ncbi:sugar transferase [Helicobacter aurati]|uniref:Sugar transferase n=1 Tax=Helicobacter aurati TaxID=137778 RepID=A0A3D8J727_9HELI|nr:sugar transferase [Helicobacter aurati]RDU72694.1 sugar transferase [Helicobacter aurati]